MLKKGHLIVLSGPSGSGKGTLLRLVCADNKDIKLSISATTRVPREGEVDGKNYFFKSKQEFEKMIDENEFIEWVKYCDNYYGTPKKYVEETLNEGFDVLLEIDAVGAIKIKKHFPESILIFILPPSFDELRNRIISRHSETPKSIAKRLKKAHQEVMVMYEYDYIVINDVIKKAAEEIESILSSEKLKVSSNKEAIDSFTNSFKI